MRILPYKRHAAIVSLLCAILMLTLGPARAADFTLWDLDGAAHKLSDYRGKWVVVNVWATWCPPCRAEMPALVFFHDAHKDKDAVVLGINFEDAEIDKVRSFLDEYLADFPILLAEPDRDNAPLGRIRGLPTTYLVSPSGEVVHERVGPVSVEYLERLLNKFKERSSSK